MSSKIFLILYFLSTIVISAQNNYFVLLVVAAFLSILAGKDFLRLSKRAFLLIAIFSLSISISYSFVMIWHGKEFLTYFLTVNLRSFDIMFLTLIFGARINIFEAFSFSKDLSFLLVMSVSKIMTLQRVFAEYTQALKSRTIRRPSNAESYHFLGSAISGFLDRSLRESKEGFEAMKSRGFDVQAN